MGLIKRNSIYFVDFVYRGKRYQKTTETKSLRKAREFEANMREKLRLGTYGLAKPDLPPTFREFVEKYLLSIETRNQLKPQTIRFYQTKTRNLLKYQPFKMARIDQIQEEHIERFTQWRLAQVTAGTVDHELATLRVLFSHAYKWKNINRIPVVKKLHLSVSRNFVLSDEQERAYLAASPSPLREIATLLLGTGLRLNEALQLKWEDVEWLEDVTSIGCLVHIRAGKSKNALRSVPVPLGASAMLKAREKAKKDSEAFVFTSRLGKPYTVTSIDHVHSKVRAALIEDEETKEMGFSDEFVLHCLRHTYLTRLGDSGAEVFAIMKLAGHGQVTTSQRYMHPSSEHLARTVARLAQSRPTEAAKAEANWAQVSTLPANFTASETQLPVSC